ncbi:hypothetical protein [Reyranella sp.]|uniref:hypothetical protein n=1 Tax=Reyranella sp. TaxID=1929291 RepID=UPI003BA94B0A
MQPMSNVGSRTGSLEPRRAAALLCAIVVSFVLAFHACGYRLSGTPAQAPTGVTALAVEQPTDMDGAGAVDSVADVCSLCGASSLPVVVAVQDGEPLRAPVPAWRASALLSLPPGTTSPPPRA